VNVPHAEEASVFDALIAAVREAPVKATGDMPRGGNEIESASVRCLSCHA
jgi:hypothetical protein